MLLSGAVPYCLAGAKWCGWDTNGPCYMCGWVPAGLAVEKPVESCAGQSMARQLVLWKSSPQNLGSSSCRTPRCCGSNGLARGDQSRFPPVGYLTTLPNGEKERPVGGYPTGREPHEYVRTVDPHHPVCMHCQWRYRCVALQAVQATEAGVALGGRPAETRAAPSFCSVTVHTLSIASNIRHPLARTGT